MTELSASPLKDRERSLVEANLFPAARHILDLEAFPWHRDRSKAATASRVHSSQALAVDLFGTLMTLAHPEPILTAWWESLGLRLSGPWKIGLEELIPKSVLGELRSSQIDAVASSPSALVLFECKFTESDGGSCSQVRPLAKGRHRGTAQCNGSYALQTNPIEETEAFCALTRKGIRYWDHIPEFLGLDSAVSYSPCPFAGGEYQWMRNVVAAGALASSMGRSGAVVLLYVDGEFPMARKVSENTWSEFRKRTDGRPVPLLATSYQTLLDLALNACHPRDSETVSSLANWIRAKIANVAGRTRG